MQFTTDDSRKIVEALGINTDSLPARRLDDIAHDVCRTDVLQSALHAFLMNQFAPAVIAALSEAERGKLAYRVAPEILAIQQGRPSQWQLLTFGLEQKPLIRVICPACRVSDGFQPLEDRGRINVTYPTLKEQTEHARSWRFKHCGREEAAPETTIQEFVRRIAPYCAGFKPTAADYEIAQIKAANAALGNRHFIELAPENIRPDTNN